MNKSCVKLRYGFATLIVWNLQKEKFYSCCFKKIKCALMSLIMLRYTLSSTSWHQTVPKWRTKLSNYYLGFVRNGLLQAHNDKCCSLVKLLCIYFCYFILFTHGQTVLNHIFSKNYVSLERYPLDEAKKTSTHWKSRNVKNAND